MESILVKRPSHLALSLLLGGILLAPASPLYAESPLPAEIAEALKNNEALAKPRNSTQTMEMQITNKRGKEKSRTLAVKTRVDGNKTYSLATVMKPEDVSGTQFLSIISPTEEPLIYLYLPSLNRTTRIKAKRQALLGSDISPADMNMTAWSNASFEDLGEQTTEVAGQAYTVRVIKSMPVDPSKSEYPQALLYLDPSDYFPRKIDFQEADGTTVKTWKILETTEIKGGKYPLKSRMSTLKKGSSTELTIKDWVLDIPDADLPLSLFDPEKMGGNEKEDEGEKSEK